VAHLPMKIMYDIEGGSTYQHVGIGINLRGKNPLLSCIYESRPTITYACSESPIKAYLRAIWDNPFFKMPFFS